MRGLVGIRLGAALLAISTALCLGLQANAQVVSTTGSGTTSFGNFGWQIDRAPVTTTVHAIAGFNSPPPFFATTATPASSFTVHEVHGTFSLATWPTWNGDPASCGNGSIIAQILDQNGNAIAAVKLQVLGPGTTGNH
jgi:hypothetical protein